MQINTRAMALGVAAGMGVSLSASADVTTIGPFIGDVYEGFEGIAPPGSVPGPVDVFNGEGTVNDQFANILVIALNLVSFVTNEEIFPYNGNLMGLSVTGRTVFTFDTPVTEFGGYFGTVDNLTGGTVSFFDEGGAPIDTQAFLLPLNNWDWYGWSSTTPIGRIEIAANVNPGTPIVFDDLFINQVPAPSGVLALVAGGALVTRRRR